MTTITNNEGKPLINNVQLRDTWRAFIELLFYDTRPEPPEIHDDTDPIILLEEV